MVYFAGVLTLFAFLATFALAIYFDNKLPDFNEYIETWHRLATLVKQNFGEHAIVTIFFGLWLGAASHTITDIAGSYVKTGRVKGLF